MNDRVIISNIEHGIEVQVRSQYRADLSDRSRMQTFDYTIRVKNLNHFPVQLIKRYWTIFDSNLNRKVVEGDGVIGEQPTLENGQFHQYTSFTAFYSLMGSMSGYFTFTNLKKETLFRVSIPQFDMFHPSLLN